MRTLFANTNKHGHRLLELLAQKGPHDQGHHEQQGSGGRHDGGGVAVVGRAAVHHLGFVFAI